MFLSPFLASFSIHAFTVKEFLETAKEEFEEKWKNPVKVSFDFSSFFNFRFIFIFSVQDFLDNAKKDFEDRWSKNDKVS